MSGFIELLLAFCPVLFVSVVGFDCQYIDDSCGRLLLPRSARLVEGHRPSVKECDAGTIVNETCVVNQTKSYSKAVEIHYHKHILIQGANISSDSSISIWAGGDLTISDSASLHAQLEINLRGNVKLIAGSQVKTESELTINGDDIIMEAVAMTASSEMVLIANFVRMSGNTSLEAGDGLTIAASKLIIEENAAVDTCGLFTFRELAPAMVHHLQQTPAEARHIRGRASAAEKLSSRSDTAHSSMTVRNKGVALIAGCFMWHASDGTVSVEDGATLVSRSNIGTLTIDADTISLSGNSTTIAVPRISLNAYSELNVTLQRMPGWSGLSDHSSQMSQHYFTNLTAECAEGCMHLGVHGGSWELGRILTIAEDIIVARHVIRTHGNNCDNQPSPLESVCIAPFSRDGHRTKPTVSFDVALVAANSLTMTGSQLFGASVFLCSNSTIQTTDSVVVDTTGRGCLLGAGQYRGSGSQASWLCGGGGGSFLGRGGWGIAYDSESIQNCSAPGDEYPYNEYHKVMPTQSAAGGGCGDDPQNRCSDEATSDTERIPSAGGGLIWISAQTWSLRGNASVHADGGKSWISPKDRAVCGGGAGGQIVLNISSFHFSDVAQVIDVSARGGSSGCRSNATETSIVMGGAGGGGFIGVAYGKCGTTPSKDQFSVDISGGSLDEECEDLVPEVALNLVRGSLGRASSLDPCLPNHTGVFCVPCGLGEWLPNTLDPMARCRSCGPLPSRFAHYVANEFCIYECSADAPIVSINPRCMDTLHFALDFFEGPEGLCRISCSALVLLVFILIRHFRLCSKVFACLTGDGSFSRKVPQFIKKACCARCSDRLDAYDLENLPHHVCRIYLLGLNSYDAPWSLSSSNVPKAVLPQINTSNWGLFAQAVDRVAVVPQWEAWVACVLGWSYPPVVPFFLRIRRRSRATKIRQVLAKVRGVNSHVPYSDLLNHRFASGVNRPCIRFGFDRGATLGYLDFLNFGQSRFDYRAPDLAHELMIMVAHGDGSYAEPYSLNIRHPVVQHLCSTELDKACMQKIVTEFNHHARKVPRAELEAEPPGASVTVLQKHVLRSAEPFRFKVHVARVIQTSKMVEEQPLHVLQEQATCDRLPSRTRPASFRQAVLQATEPIASFGSTGGRAHERKIFRSWFRRTLSFDEDTLAPLPTHLPELAVPPVPASLPLPLRPSNPTLATPAARSVSSRPRLEVEALSRLDSNLQGSAQWDHIPSPSQMSSSGFLDAASSDQPFASRTSPRAPPPQPDLPHHAFEVQAIARKIQKTSRPASFGVEDMRIPLQTVSESPASPSTMLAAASSSKAQSSPQIELRAPSTFTIASLAADEVNEMKLGQVMKLCLVFAHPDLRCERALSSTSEPRTTCTFSSGCSTTLGPQLSSPLPTNVFHELLDGEQLFLHKPTLQREHQDSEQLSVPEQIRRAARRVFVYWPLKLKESKSKKQQAAVLVFLIALLFLDVLTSVFWCTVIAKISPWLLTLWMLLPPLATPLALGLGLTFILLERPFMGRLYAAFTTYSLLGLFCSMICTMIRLSAGSWIFNVVVFAWACTCKGALFVVITIHIRNLEFARDRRACKSVMHGSAAGTFEHEPSFSDFHRARDDRVIFQATGVSSASPDNAIEREESPRMTFGSPDSLCILGLPAGRIHSDQFQEPSSPF